MSQSKKIVISGLGIISAIATRREEFWQALMQGVNGAKDISLFDTTSFSVHQAAEILDFNPKEYLGPKGHRSLDRATKLIVSAAKLALEDAALTINNDNADDVGVALGSTLGSVKSISDFDVTTLKDGPRYTNPAHFPNTVINSPASQISIWHKMKAFNTTISTGFTASLDALCYGIDAIGAGRAKIVFAGGVEELCYQTFLAFYRLNFLSGCKDGNVFNCPFDQRRNGILLGEAAALLVCEDGQYAQARGAAVLGTILGVANVFDPYRNNKYNPKGSGVKTAICRCLKNANCEAHDIDLICANANSTLAADRIECEAIKEIFGGEEKPVAITAIKSMVGECFSASGVMSVAAALGAIHKGVIPPTINFEKSDECCRAALVVNQARKANIEKVLVINFGPNGACSCVIIGA